MSLSLNVVMIKVRRLIALIPALKKTMWLLLIPPRTRFLNHEAGLQHTRLGAGHRGLVISGAVAVKEQEQVKPRSTEEHCCQPGRRYEMERKGEEIGE
eukprot:404764-Hanusia_phi.AAC.1